MYFVQWADWDGVREREFIAKEDALAYMAEMSKSRPPYDNGFSGFTVFYGRKLKPTEKTRVVAWELN